MDTATALAISKVSKGRMCSNVHVWKLQAWMMLVYMYACQTTAKHQAHQAASVHCLTAQCSRQRWCRWDVQTCQMLLRSEDHCLGLTRIQQQSVLHKPFGSGGADLCIFWANKGLAMQNFGMWEPVRDMGWNVLTKLQQGTSLHHFVSNEPLSITFRLQILTVVWARKLHCTSKLRGKLTSSTTLAHANATAEAAFLHCVSLTMGVVGGDTEGRCLPLFSRKGTQ